MGSKIEEPYKPLQEMSIDKHTDSKYLRVEVKAPYLTGIPLRIFTWSLESPILGSLILKYMKNDNLITKIFVKSQLHEPPMHIPHYPNEVYEEPAVLQLDWQLSPSESVALAVKSVTSSLNSKADEDFFHRWTICDYANAYSSGKVTPMMVANRFLSAVEDSLRPAPGMGFFINYDKQNIMKQAAESTDRYSKGAPLSILDGVPIAVKDEIDCLPYPTTGGSTWMDKVRPVKTDAECTKRLRKCGAVLVGKTNMHVLGMGTTSINPHYGATRNPYDRQKFTGGSSGGSAGLVAAGLCPAALGVDGGGSVRMPAGLCGVIGFKGTFGRITNAGVLPLNWTIGMVGVIAASVEDAIIMYAAIHGHLPGDRIISIPPPAKLPLLRHLKETNLQVVDLVRSLKLAKYTEWFDDSDDEVKSTCHKALDLIQQTYGCKVIELTIPELEEMRLAHYITMASECYTALGADYEKVGIDKSSLETRVCFDMYSCFSNREFIGAQRIRSRQMYYHMEIFKKADIIVSPTTACTAQPIKPGALKHGELNYVTGGKLMRFQIAGNLLGLPAVSVPVGYDSSGMPVGLQLIGRPWCEATILRLAFAIQSLYSRDQRQPEVFYNML